MCFAMDSLESNPEPRFLAIGKGVMLELSTLTKGFFSHFEGTTHEDIDQFRKKKKEENVWVRNVRREIAFIIDGKWPRIGYVVACTQ